MVSLCGPRDVVRDRIAAFRDAGVGTLIGHADGVHRRGADRAAARGRRAGRLTAAGRCGLPRRVRPARSRLPDARARRRSWRRRGHEVTFETWSRWREHVEAGGMRFVAAPEYPVFPDAASARSRPVRGGRPRHRADAPAAVGRARPDVVVHDILTLAPALAGELEGVPVATLIPHVYPVGAARLSAVRGSARACRGRAWARAVGGARAPARDRAAPRPRRAERHPRAGSGWPPVERLHGGPERAAVPGRNAAPARVPALVARARARRRAADVGAAVRRRRAAARRERRSCSWPRRPPRIPSIGFCGPRSTGWPASRSACWRPGTGARCPGRARCGRTPGSSSGSPTRRRCRDARWSICHAGHGTLVRALACGVPGARGPARRRHGGERGPAGLGRRRGAAAVAAALAGRSASRSGGHCRSARSRIARRSWRHGRLSRWRRAGCRPRRATRARSACGLGGRARTNSTSSGASPSATSIGSPEQLHNSTTARAR